MLHSFFVRAAALALTSLPTLLAQTVQIHGTGGWTQQNLYAIQRNVALGTSTGTTVIAPTGADRRIFVRFVTGATAGQATGFDLKMKFSFLDEVVPAWIYTADGANAPGSAIASGEIGIGLSMHYCRASMANACSLSANRLYFVAFRLPAGEQVTFATHPGTSTPCTYFVTANGTPQQAGIQLGVHTGGNNLRIAMTQPVRGATFQVSALGGAADKPSFLLAADALNPWAIDLYPTGGQGSFYYLSLASAYMADFLPAGVTARTYYVPNDPSLQGVPLALQWLKPRDNNGDLWLTSTAATAVVQ